MKFRKTKMWIGLWVGAITLIVAVVWTKVSDHQSLISFFLTPDQQGRLLFNREHYIESAKVFRDPTWQATAWYRAGEFKKAAGIFAGLDTAEGAFNQGNALAMQGKYADAIPRYERALELRSGWKDAEFNLKIVRQSAEKLKQEGGEGTGGKLGADDIQFSKDPPKGSTGDEEAVEGDGNISEAEVQAMWLRRVQTKPADFLRAKFAYQAAMKEK